MSVARKILRKNSARRTKQNRFMLVLNCVICTKKKSSLIENQEGSGLLKKLGIITPLSILHYSEKIRERLFC